VAYSVLYHPDVKAKDIPAMNRDQARRAAHAIETRLTVDPARYGEPLRRTLKGYWKLRVGNYRGVFKIVKNEVWVFGVMHRRGVYERIGKRLPSN
jgi:mRNA interferase RelE/StbE